MYVLSGRNNGSRIFKLKNEKKKIKKFQRKKNLQCKVDHEAPRLMNLFQVKWTSVNSH